MKSDSKKHSVNAKQRRKRVMILAGLLRYGLPISVLVLALIVGKVTGSGRAAVAALGAGCLILGLYELLAYLLKWKHFYCAYQNAYYQDMTPDKIDWEKVRKSDAYGVPAIFITLGIACLAVLFLA